MPDWEVGRPLFSPADSAKSLFFYLFVNAELYLNQIPLFYETVDYANVHGHNKLPPLFRTVQLFHDPSHEGTQPCDR